MSQPTVTIVGLDPSEQVYLLPFSDPEFARSLDAGRAKELDVLFPYTPMIKNDSEKEVIAYSVQWICTDSVGKVRAHEVTIFDFMTFRPGSNLPPHASRLVSHIFGLGTPLARWSAASQTESSQLLASFQKQTSIVISLEAVVFEDGRAVGRDRNNWIPRWRAQIDAERDVYTEVSASSPGKVRGFLDKYREAAFERARPVFREQGKDVTYLSEAARHLTEYPDCYVVMRGLFALRVLEIVRADGEEAVIQEVKDYLGSKRYPNVRRKEL